MFGSVAGITFEPMVRNLSDRRVTDDALPQHDDIVRTVRAGARDHTSAHLRMAEPRYGDDLDRPLDQVVEHRLGDLGNDGRPAAEQPSPRVSSPDL